jgi:acyl-CoA synthetase (AMP-forming)/AMP-acid ligase II
MCGGGVMSEVVRRVLPGPMVPDGRLEEVVLSICAAQPDRVAMVEGALGAVLTCGELVARVERCATWLRRRGVGAGDVIAVVAANGPAFPVALFGGLLAGAACAPINPACTPAEVTAQVRAVGAALVAAGTEAVATAVAASAGWAVGVVEVAPDGLHEIVAPDARPGSGVADVGAAVLLSSSGTTGAAKHVALTHRNLLAHAVQCEVWGLTPADVLIAVSPFSHSMGLSALLVHGLSHGVPLVTMPRFDLSEFLGALQAHRVTAALVAPPVVRRLAEHPAVDAFDLSSLRWVVSGAAALPVPVQDRCSVRLKCPVSEAWGMSEAGLVAAAAPHQGRPGSVGPPVAGVELRVVDPDTGRDLAVGDVGELLVRGPNVMAGYLGDRGATAAALRAGGWLRSGDLGHVDADSYVTLVDRLKEMIKYNGFAVAPAELEALLCRHPAVLDAAVVPSPDESAGEVPKAYLVLQSGVDPVQAAREAVARVGDQVATYKHIRRVEVIDAMPRSPSGKLLRRVLVERERGLPGQS